MKKKTIEHHNVDLLIFEEHESRLLGEGMSVPVGLSGKVSGHEVSGTIELQIDAQLIRKNIEKRPPERQRSST